MAYAGTEIPLYGTCELTLSHHDKNENMLSGRPLLLGASNGVVYIYIFITRFCAASVERRASSDIAISAD